MNFHNSTHLSDERLLELFQRHTAPYQHEQLTVRVRYSRSAAFSGACYYRDARIHVNLGRRNRYPYALATHVARAESNRTHWWREVYVLDIASAYELVLFVYLHELFHWLVMSAGRCPRRKEAMCDRFATRVLIDQYGARLSGARGRPVPRAEWDFQNLDAFVAAAPKQAG